MKKEKQESPAKAAKKIATKSIQQRLIKILKTITSELGQVEVDIEKEAKKLAKKITKHLKTVKEPEKSTTPETGAKKVQKKPEPNNAKPVVKAAPVAVVNKPAAKTATKTAPVAAAKTPLAKAVPVRASAPKKDAAKTTATKSTKK
jgi:hypothetical protein